MNSSTLSPRPAPAAFAVWRLTGRGWSQIGVTSTHREADALARGRGTVLVLPLGERLARRSR